MINQHKQSYKDVNDTEILNCVDYSAELMCSPVLLMFSGHLFAALYPCTTTSALKSSEVLGEVKSSKGTISIQALPQPPPTPSLSPECPGPGHSEAAVP